METLNDLITAVRTKKQSRKEVAQMYLERIKEKDKEINSYIFVNEDIVAQAEQADIVANEESLLFGIPYAVKDNILVEGMRCTAGSKTLEEYEAPYDATVVERLRRAGALVLGKTNMDEFAMGSSTEHSAFGPTKNPRDVTRVPGGSSGGSAAAVAAGLAPFALGSDTGGSIRQPAAFCGVVGYKPTYGAVSRHGLIAMASSLDQIGTLTRTVEDAKTIASYLLGRDSLDATSQDTPVLEGDITPKEITIGIVKEQFGDGLNKDIKKRLEEAIKQYEAMGVRVKEISLPNIAHSLPVYYILMPAEVSSNMARYDGIRYGAHAAGDKAKDLIGYYLQNRQEGLGDEVRRRVMLGTYTLSAGYYEAYYAKAQKVRTLIKQDFEKAFEDVDIIASPATPDVPFKFGAKSDDPLAMYLEDIYTVSANLAGVPGITIPAGTVKEDGIELPVGLQLVGRQRDDYRLLEVASWLEREGEAS